MKTESEIKKELGTLEKQMDKFGNLPTERLEGYKAGLLFALFTISDLNKLGDEMEPKWFGDTL